MLIEFPGEFVARRAERRDTARIIELMAARHPGSFALRHEWLYHSNPHGPAVTWLAVERATGRLAGCTSVFPRRLLVHGRRHRAALGGDCFVSPAFRRRGVATLLHRATAAGLAEEGIELMFGPPNPANYAALCKSGARPVGTFGSWTRPLAPGPCRVPKLAARLGLAVLDRMTGRPQSGFHMDSITFDARGCDDFFERVGADYDVLGARDMRYVRWRYLESVADVQRPFVVRNMGRVVGFVVLEAARARLHIVDFLTFRDPATIDAALALVVAHGKRLGCEAVEINAKSESTLGARLPKRGFLPRAQRGFQVLGAAGATLPEIVLKPEAWHFLNGDEDLDQLVRARPPQVPSGSATMAS
jgi:hypothetical protein